MSRIIDGYTIPGRQRETALAPEALLHNMEAAGINAAVIAPEDHELAVHHEAGNQRLLDIAADSDGRLIPACTVSPWRGDAALIMVQDAVRRGAKLLVLAPHLQGFIPTDEITDPLLKLAGELHLPVYIHTGPHAAGGPTQVVLLAERFKQTPFILGHCGSTDHAWDMLAILKSHRQPNVWYETSFVRPHALNTYIEVLGEDRFIFGSATPRNDQAFELQQVTQHIDMARMPGLFGGNLQALLEDVRHDC